MHVKTKHYLVLVTQIELTILSYLAMDLRNHMMFFTFHMEALYYLNLEAPEDTDKKGNQGKCMAKQQESM